MSTPYVGQALTRPDAAAKATGRAVYIHDLERPGMLHGAIRFADVPHARIVNIDTSAAERLPGVRAVITGTTAPHVRFGFLRDNEALKRDTVRCPRDEVAAVAAIDPDIAREAAALIHVEYEPLDAVFDPAAALAAGAPLVHALDPDGTPRTSNRLDLVFRHRSGDIEASRRASTHIVAGTYSTPLIQQSCMGTSGCIAELDPSGNLTMWAKTQIPFMAQRDFNRALADMGLRGRNSRVIVPALGGAFGTGLDTHAYEYIAILLAHRTGLPIKMLYTRPEEFARLSPRQSTVVHIEHGCDDAGRLTFRDIRVVQDNGAYTSWGATYPSVMLLPATSLYRVDAVHFDCDIVYTNNPYCQAMRGYGNPEVTWALESSLDDLAREASIDPLEIRLRNCNQAGDTTPMGLEIGTCGLEECLRGTAERLDWEGSRKKRGVGIASLIHVGGSGRIYRSDASGIALRLDDYGNVYVASGGVEMGQGLHAAVMAVVADALGVRPDQVFIQQPDTATCPWDVGTHASRGAFVCCNAAIMACNTLRDDLFVAARELAGLEGELDLRDGLVSEVEGSGSISLGKLCRKAHFRADGQIFSATAFYDPPSELPDWERGMGNMSPTYAWGSQGVEVEVDEDTGEVRILKLVAVHDVGRVLNPTTLAGQIYGALAQGLGYALYEQVVTERGHVMNPDFRDYKIPTAVEMGMPIELAFIEPGDEYGPHGAKGVGEPGLVPTAPAIANAIADAVGVRIFDLPITPERVLAALAERDRG
jgi:xanthine dehydrogenase molybdenum-binding subunit